MLFVEFHFDTTQVATGSGGKTKNAAVSTTKVTVKVVLFDSLRFCFLIHSMNELRINFELDKK